MRVNVYAEEMTDRVEIISKTIDGHAFTGLRLYLYMPTTLQDGSQAKGPFIHRPGDDDSSAITFWGKRDLRQVLRGMLNKLDAHYDGTPPEPGHIDETKGSRSLHAFTDDEETVIAYDIEDAIAVMRERAGDDVWGNGSGVDIEDVPDDRIITIVDGDNGNSVKRTAAEWALSNGRGYLCGPVD